MLSSAFSPNTLLLKLENSSIAKLLKAEVERKTRLLVPKRIHLCVEINRYTLPLQQDCPLYSRL